MPENIEKYIKFRGYERYKEREEVLANICKEIDEDYSSITKEEILPEREEILDKTSELKDQLAETFEKERKEASKLLFEYMRERGGLIKKEEKLSQLYEKAINLIKEKGLEDETEVWERVERIEEGISEFEKKLNELARENPIAFLANGLLTLREYKKQLPSGIVETPFVKELKREILERIGKKGVAALVGETGTGKTLVAAKIAREMTGAEPEWVFGNIATTKEDLLGYLGIKIKEIPAEEVPELIEKAKKIYQEKNPDLAKEILERNQKIIEEIIKGQASQRQIETEQIIGPVLRAAEEGKSVIVDEFNYINPGVLASLNKLVEAKPGEIVEFAGQKIEIKPGFSIIFTGNISKAEVGRYLQRQKLDPAFVNRLNASLIEYNTPPQEIKRSLEASILEEKEILEAKEVSKRDLFQIGLAHLVDKKGNLKAKENSLEQLWRLSQEFSLLQRLFAGEKISEEEIPKEIAGTRFDLREYHASLRTFGDIIKDWKKEAFKYKLDWYIFDGLIRPANIISSKEAAQFFYLMKNHGDFFQDEVWKEIKIDPISWNIEGIEKLAKNEKKIKENLQSEEKTKYYLPQEIVEALVGERMPREIKGKERIQEAIDIEKYVEAEKILKRLREVLGEYRKITKEIVNEKGEKEIIEEERASGIEFAIEKLCKDERKILGK